MGLTLWRTQICSSQRCVSTKQVPPTCLPIAGVLEGTRGHLPWGLCFISAGSHSAKISLLSPLEWTPYPSEEAEDDLTLPETHRALLDTEGRLVSCLCSEPGTQHPYGGADTVPPSRERELLTRATCFARVIVFDPHGHSRSWAAVTRQHAGETSQAWGWGITFPERASGQGGVEAKPKLSVLRALVLPLS